MVDRNFWRCIYDAWTRLARDFLHLATKACFIVIQDNSYKRPATSINNHHDLSKEGKMGDSNDSICRYVVIPK